MDILETGKTEFLLAKTVNISGSGHCNAERDLFRRKQAGAGKQLHRRLEIHGRGPLGGGENRKHAPLKIVRHAVGGKGVDQMPTTPLQHGLSAQLSEVPAGLIG